MTEARRDYATRFQLRPNSLARKPISVFLPKDVDAIVRSLPNRSHWLREAIMEKLNRDEITQPVITSEPDVTDPEDQAWMDADLSRLGEFEPYEWEPCELEGWNPVDYVPGKGMVIGEE